MSTFKWVPIEVILAIHDRQISRHGGASGLRDLGLLESGAGRAQNRASYDNGSVFEIAAAYAYGLAKAHGFVDGNKRTAFVVALTFLRLNGFHMRPDPLEGVRMMEGLASDAVSEVAFTDWVAKNSRPLSEL